MRFMATMTLSMEKDFSTNQKRILQVVQGLSSQKMDILLLIDMSLIMLKR